MHPQTEASSSPLTSAKLSDLFCRLMTKSKLIRGRPEAEWGYRGLCWRGPLPCRTKEHGGASTHFNRRELPGVLNREALTTAPRG